MLGSRAPELLTVGRNQLRLKRMFSGNLSYWGCWVALGLACASCGGDAAAPKPAACDVAGRDTDFCRVSVRRELACSTSTESEEALLAQCRTRLEDYPNRVAPCFVAELGECLASGCEGGDKCYTDAIVANDPSVVDVERYRACSEPVFGRETTASPIATGCDDLPVGFLKACIERAHECSVLDDLCSSVVAMKQPYRGESEACLERSCTELAGCLYTAMGRTKPQ